MKWVLVFLCGLLVCTSVVSATAVTMGYPFGGIYGRFDAFTLTGASATGSVLYPNPATNGQSCPSAAYTPMKFFGGGKGLADLWVCLGKTESKEMKYDFGGMYLVKKQGSVEVGLEENPFTNARCPTGYTDVPVNLMSRGNFNPTYVLHWCYRTHTAAVASSYFLGGVHSTASIKDPSQSAAPSHLNEITQQPSCSAGYATKTWNFLQSLSREVGVAKETYQMDSSLSFCWKGSDAPAVTPGEVKTCSAPDQVLFSLFTREDSHVSEWNDTNAKYQICYQDLFPGKTYVGDFPHDCAPGMSNQILQLSSSKSAHVASATAVSVNHPIDVCYGNLEACSLRENACLAGEATVASFPPGFSIGVHVADAASTAYTQKICCLQSTAPAFLKVEWIDALTNQLFVAKGTQAEPLTIQTTDRPTPPQGVRELKLVATTTANLVGKHVQFVVQEHDGGATNDPAITSPVSVPIVAATEGGTAVGKAELLWTIRDSEFRNGFSGGENEESVFQYFVQASLVENSALTKTSTDLYVKAVFSQEPQIMSVDWLDRDAKSILVASYTAQEGYLLLGTVLSSELDSFTLKAFTSHLPAGTMLFFTIFEKDSSGTTPLRVNLQAVTKVDGSAMVTWKFLEGEFSAGLAGEDVSEDPQVLELGVSVQAQDTFLGVPEATSEILHVEKPQEIVADNRWHCELKKREVAWKRATPTSLLEQQTTKEILAELPGYPDAVNNNLAAEMCKNALEVPVGEVCCPTGYVCGDGTVATADSEGRTHLGCYQVAAPEVQDCAWLGQTSPVLCDGTSPQARAAALADTTLGVNKAMCSGALNPCNTLFCACKMNGVGVCGSVSYSSDKVISPLCTASACTGDPKVCTETITGTEAACSNGYRTITKTNTLTGTCPLDVEIPCENNGIAVPVQVPCGASSVTLPFFGAWQALGAVIAIVILYIVLFRSRLLRRAVKKSVRHR